MRKIKNFIALFLIALVAIVAVPKTFALITKDSVGTIDLSGIKEAVKVTAYRVMDVNIAEYTDTNKNAPQNPVYKWTSDVAGWVGTNHPTYIDTTNENAVTDAFNNTLTNKKELAEFYAAMADAIKGETITITDTNKIEINATGNGTDKIENAKMGNYLIVIENGQKYTYNPSTVNVVPVYNNGWTVSNPKAVIKFTNPSIEKTTNEKTEAEAQIGTVIPYTIKVDVPNYKSNFEKKTLTVTDTLSKGLTFNGTIKVFGVKGTNKQELAVETNYTFEKTNNDNGSTTIKVLINEEQYEALRESAIELKYDELVIEYSATVNANAIESLDTTKNSATLTYYTDPETAVTTDPTIVKVYTYNIKINKLDGNRQSLPGAVFSVANARGTKLSFVNVSDGVYRLATNTDTTKVTNLVVNSEDGTLYVKGLASGTYYVTEEEAPAGYVKLQNPTEIVITDANEDGIIDGIIEGSNNNTIESNVINTTGFELPVTGGMGTLLFSIIGVAFMGLGAFLIKNISKKNKENNM